MAQSQLQEHIIFRWLSLKNTIEYLGEWEMLYNPHFNCTEFGTIKILRPYLSMRECLKRKNNSPQHNCHPANASVGR